MLPVIVSIFLCQEDRQHGGDCAVRTASSVMGLKCVPHAVPPLIAEVGICHTGCQNIKAATILEPFGDL